MQRLSSAFIVSLLLIVANQASLFAENIDYLTQVKPLLDTKCFGCHGVIKQEANLRLDSKEFMLRGGDSGAVLTLDNPKKSLLLERINGDEFTQMPPVDEGSALKPEEIRIVQLWIEQGAIAPHEQIVENPLDHWAFQKIHPPADSNASIDSLLTEKRRELGLISQQESQRSLLIRRVYLDLIGLPPTLEQLHDDRRWEDIVDELLASPHYGERWGRHWMDIWRYSDWYGLGAQLRYSQKHLWHWRDWIVNSLNDDKGYDRMILEMLAGDELAPEKFEVVAATGYLARNYYLFNRTTWLDSTIEHTGKAFLGLTLNCAKCHDHKYDPISQKDYYNFRAIFEPHQVRLDPIAGELDLEKDGLPRVFDDHLNSKTFLHIKGDPKNPDESIEIVPRVPELLADFQDDAKPVGLPVVAYAPALREDVVAALREKKTNAVKVAQEALKSAELKFQRASQETLATGKKTEELNFSFSDDFSEPRPDMWKITGPDWKYEDGRLLRTTSTRAPETIQYLEQLPHDFEITCQYKITGGATYKSVTFRFDQTQDRSYDNLVYTSAHTPGPKVQTAFTRNGKTVYPPNGRVGRPIEVGKEYTLRFAVKGKLINVWLNDEFVLAYAFPDRKYAGSFAFGGFDATVAFDSISIRSLPSDFKMQSVKGVKDATIVDPKLTLQVAKSNLEIAIAGLEAFEKTLMADRASLLGDEEEVAGELKSMAALSQIELSHLQAKHALLLAAQDQKKIDDATKKIEASRKELELARQGEVRYKSLKASQKALETPAHKFEDYSSIYPDHSTGRRLSLARWVVDKRNPLTARVAVNHIWLRHFGRPLVESVFDFGLRSKIPEQHELLDYLAWEFMESGWSMKHLHRRIVTSQVYRLNSSTLDADSETLLKDPGNDFYWRMNSQRMEAQIVRDSLLNLAGELDPSFGGPSLDTGNKSRRRSLYFKHSRDQHNKFLAMFDDADLLQCYRRDVSVVPQQALALANSQLSLEMAELIAEKRHAEHETQTAEEFTLIAFETILCRLPTAEETAACQEYMAKLGQTLDADRNSEKEKVIRSRLVHALLNHNDFISIR